MSRGGRQVSWSLRSVAVLARQALYVSTAFAERVVGVVKAGSDESPRLGAPQSRSTCIFNEDMSLGQSAQGRHAARRTQGRNYPKSQFEIIGARKQQSKDQRTDRFAVAAPS